jgi:hypothetical protein
MGFFAAAKCGPNPSLPRAVDVAVALILAFAFAFLVVIPQRSEGICF